MRTILTLSAVLALAMPCAGEEVPASDVRVLLDSAAITGLDCSGRGFELEQTKSAARWYAYMGHGMRTEDWDPRPIVMGVFGCALLAPVTVLAVPVDLFSMPFRKQCSFDLELRGSLVGWAGQGVGDLKVGAFATNVADRGVPGVSEPVVFRSSASTVSDSGGRFSITVPGYVGRDKSMDISWSVKGRPASGVKLRKKGGKFTIVEGEAEFGSSMSFEEPAPLVVNPEPKR